MTLTDQALQQLFKDIDATGVTMVCLGAESGVTRMTLNNWRTGRTVPALNKFLSVRRVIDGRLQQISSQENELPARLHARIKKRSSAVQ